MNATRIRRFVSGVGTGVFVLGLFLTSTMMCLAPACLPLYMVLAVLALVPLVVGPRAYRVAGGIAFAVALLGAANEYLSAPSLR
jgi:hypothetical protein